MVTGSVSKASMAIDASVDNTRSIVHKFGQTLRAILRQRGLVGAALGPLVGGAIWWLPLGLEPVAHRALAIAAFMVVYWIMDPIEPGITALLGCVLFWALQVTTFSSA